MICFAEHRLERHVFFPSSYHLYHMIDAHVVNTIHGFLQSLCAASVWKKELLTTQVEGLKRQGTRMQHSHLTFQFDTICLHQGKPTKCIHILYNGIYYIPRTESGVSGNMYPHIPPERVLKHWVGRQIRFCTWTKVSCRWTSLSKTKGPACLYSKVDIHLGGWLPPHALLASPQAQPLSVTHLRAIQYFGSTTKYGCQPVQVCLQMPPLHQFNASLLDPLWVL